ncbi:MAG: aldehyde dehydrogenase [Oscillospiraceae bacterium]
MEIQEIVARQREFFNSGKTLPIEGRLELLKKLKLAIKESEGEINAALKADLNKSEFEGYMTEIGMVLDDLGFAIKHLRSWAKNKSVHTPLAQFSAKSFVVAEPFGVALIMSPWNYPFQLTIDPLIGAISAGNCAIIKPSAYAANTSRAIAKLIAKVFPPEYVAVVEGGRAENTMLLQQRFDYIFFTGSVAVGKHVMECASKNLTPISLELGGKSPVIIDKTANLKLAAKRLAFGKYLNAGQTCVAPDYLLIDEAVQEEFIVEFKKAVESFYPNGDFSALPTIINDKHFERVSGLIQKEKLVLGGKTDPTRRFIEPSLLRDVTWEDPIMQEEIFGPLLPILSFKNLDEALEQIISRPKPLALYLFTNDKATEKKVLSRVSFGGGCINDTIIHLATPHMGFGGVGDSGMGAYHGRLSFDTFTHYKSMVKKHNFIDLPMRYQPYTALNFKILRMFMK